VAGALILAAGTLGTAGCAGTANSSLPSPPPLPAACRPPQGRTLDLPSFTGLNYGMPDTVNGQWVGTAWLRPDVWPQVEPRLVEDLDFMQAHHLGRVQRIFIGLDQLMVWNPRTGFVRFDPAALEDFQQALDLFQAHGMKVYAVVFDQEVRSSPGNFRVQALDGHHPAMRRNYLRALRIFLQRYGEDPEVVAWDLFNEAYNSLGTEGGLPRPPAADPTSPNYPDPVVYSWITDLYRTARCAAPKAWFTVSDTTELYWHNPPDTALYRDAVDFYDIHVYASHPSPPDWRRYLHLPYLLGEVGADYPSGFDNRSTNAAAVSWWLAHGRQLGVRAVLAHAADGAIYSLASGHLTPAGRAVEEASS
jgi:hypothetical protein